MANNQNPVFTDNSTITGDGTVADPLAAAAGILNPPGGATGDIQVKSSANHFTNFAGQFAGAIGNIDSTGNLAFSVPEINLTSTTGLGITIHANGGGFIDLESDSGVSLCQFTAGIVQIGGATSSLKFFNGASGAGRQAITGAKLPSDTVMANLLTALAILGLITDSTT